MNKDWTEINEPFFEVEGFIDILLDKISILDILTRCSVEYYSCKSGDFSHKAKCPLPIHSFGNERTPSFFISEENNTFYCFGCNSGTNIIDFIRMFFGKPFLESIKWLSDYSNITESNMASLPTIHIGKINIEKRVVTHAFRTGIIIRNYLYKIKKTKEYNAECLWADRQFIKIDKYLYILKDEDWKIVKIYYDKIYEYIKGK